MCLVICILTFIEASQQDRGKPVLLSTGEVKLSQILVVWGGDIWPLSAHQDPLAAAGHMAWGGVGGD